MTPIRTLAMRRLLLAGAAALGITLPLGAQALALNAAAAYNVPGTGGAGITPASGSPQASDTNVDILDFSTVGNVGLGIHTYGSISPGGTTFGDRVSADVQNGGPASYDVDGTLTVQLDNVGDTFSFNIIPGEISANGSSSFVSGDFVSAHIRLSIMVDGVSAFMSDAAASFSGDAGASTSATGDNINASCSSGADFASCILGGGPQMLAGLDTLTGSAAPHSLTYTLFAEVHGNLSNYYSDCGTSGGGGEVFAAALVIVPGGGGGTCGSVARTGDPLPEPGTVALAGLGLAALAILRRKRPGIASD